MFFRNRCANNRDWLLATYKLCNLCFVRNRCANNSDWLQPKEIIQLGRIRGRFVKINTWYIQNPFSTFMSQGNNII